MKIRIEEIGTLFTNLKGKGELQFEEGKGAIPFALLEIGERHLNSVFGIYRPPNIKEGTQILKDEGQFNGIVEIFEYEGKVFGSETLIEALSYKIYKDNSSQMEQCNIPIKVPEGEKPISNFNQRLLITTYLGYINLQKLNESLSRPIIYNYLRENKRGDLFFDLHSEVIDYIISSGGEVKIELANENGEWKEVPLRVDMDDAMNFLKERFKKEVLNFKNLLQATFGNFQERLEKFGFDEFGIGDIAIYLSGNTTKSPLLKEAFIEVFCKEDNLLTTEELEKNLIEVQDPEKRVTVKNAVARGALFLSTMGVYNHTLGFGGKMPLDRYLWNIEMVEEGKITPVFRAGDNDQKDFEIISRFSDFDGVKIFHSKREIENFWEGLIISIPEEFRNKNSHYLYGKPYSGSIIEVAVGDDNGWNSATFFIDLNTGKVMDRERGEIGEGVPFTFLYPFGNGSLYPFGGEETFE